MEAINENDLKKTYELLAHEKQTELRIFPPGREGGTKEVFVKDWTEFLDAVKKYNGKEDNIYAGINERKPYKKDGASVISVQTVVIDIDSNHPKDEPATDEELAKAKETADKICEWFVSNRFNRPSVAMSGNGYQLWTKIPKVAIHDGNREVFQEKLQLFQEEVKQFSTKDAKVDKIGDLPRIIKVIGTLSVKGTPSNGRPHRLSKWVSWEKNEPDGNLLTHITGLELPKKTTTPSTTQPEAKAVENGEKTLFELVKEKITIFDIHEGLDRTKEKQTIECIFCEKLDARPALSIFAHGKRFNCFGCGAHGDVIGFFSKREKITLKKAASMLAERYGIEQKTDEATATCFVQDGDTLYQQTTQGFVNQHGEYFTEVKIGETTYKPLEGVELKVRQGNRAPFLKLAVKPEPYGNFQELLKEIEIYFEKYVDLDEDFRKISALYSVLTWFQDKLRTVPYWRVRGDFGKGKSRAWDVMRGVCCNSLSGSGALTSAPLFRIIEKWGIITLALDEADLPKKTDETNDIVKIVNTGFEQGGGVMRCNVNDPSQIEMFSTFCPKLFSMRYAFQDQATESRCFSYDIRATQRKDIPVELNDDFEEDSERLRNKLLAYRFAKYVSFKRETNPQFPENLEGRVKQLAIAFYPLLETPADRIWFNNWLVKYQEKLRAERADSVPGNLLQVIIEQCSRAKGKEAVNQDLAFPTAKTVAEEFDADYQTVSKELRALGFTSQPVSWTDALLPKKRSAKALKISKERWNEACDRYSLNGSEESYPNILTPTTDELKTKINKKTGQQGLTDN